MSVQWFRYALLAGWLVAATAQADTGAALMPAEQAVASQAPRPTVVAGETPAVPPAREPVRTLEVIDALRPEVDWTPDPFARRPNRFDNRFGRGPSPEEIALQHGGYLMYGITQALAKGGSWLNRVTGGPAQIQHAQARDVPLDDEQIARAARWASQTQVSDLPADGGN